MVEEISKLTTAAKPISSGVGALGAPSSKLNSQLSNGLSFKDHLTAEQGKTSTAAERLLDGLKTIGESWSDSRLALEQRVQGLPKDARAMIDLQSSFHKLQLGTSMVTKVGESANATLRRLQQMGAG